MIRLLLSILANAAALYAAQYFVPDFIIEGGLKEYAIAGVALGLLNLIVKPILKTVSFPLIILTLGLFTLVINAALVWGLDWLFAFITISTWEALALGTLIITVINFIVSHGKKHFT